MWTCTCTCVVPWSISRCTELRSSLRTPDVFKTTSDAACLYSQKRSVSRVEYGPGRVLFIGNERHLAPLQSLVMQTSGTKAKSQKQIATDCWQYHWNASENVRTPEHVSQGAAKLAARANSLQLVRLPFRGFLSRSCGYERDFWTSRKLRTRRRKSFQAHSQPNIVERGRAEKSLSSSSCAADRLIEHWTANQHWTD